MKLCLNIKFLLVIINNDTHAKNYSTDVTLRYYGLGAQIIKDYKKEIWCYSLELRKK